MIKLSEIWRDADEKGEQEPCFLFCDRVGAGCRRHHLHSSQEQAGLLVDGSIRHRADGQRTGAADPLLSGTDQAQR